MKKKDKQSQQRHLPPAVGSCWDPKVADCVFVFCFCSCISKNVPLACQRMFNVLQN